MDRPIEIAVVIVTWNVRDLALACLRSVYEDAKAGDVVIKCAVVDNASADGTADAVRQRFPQVTVIEPGENLGFARGNNAGIRSLGVVDSSEFPRFVLCLNPDTVVHSGALKALIHGMESVGAGLAGARLVYGDGSFQHSAFAFPGLAQLIIDLFPVPARIQESPINGRYSRRLYESGQPFKIDHPLGATFMVRREVIQHTGLFDEQFQLYCEEVDWAMRIRQAGWTAICAPSAVVVHYGGQSTAQAKPQSVLNLWTARLKLYRKHYSLLKQRVAEIIVRAGMRRLISVARRDTSLDAASRSALIGAYEQIIGLTRLST